jgi:hemerythrin-like domain-containing protein
VKNIIKNLTRQHRELTRVTMEIVPRLEAAQLAADATPVRRSLQALTGILKVHISMEDQSFYPFLRAHRDDQLRQLAENFLTQRDQIQDRYFAYVSEWLEPGRIERDTTRFIDETRAILLTLGTRMLQEDREFHPLVLERAAREG